MFRNSTGMTALVLFASVAMLGCVGLGSVPVGSKSGAIYALPKGLIHLKLKQETAAPNSLAIEDADSLTVPDPGFRYVLNYRPSAMADDALVITTTKNGLLTQIDFTSDEKTDEFIVKVAELGKEVFKAATFTPFAVVGDEDTYKTVYDSVFDPFDPNDLARVQQDVSAFGGGYTIAFPIPPAGVVTACPKDKVCFRRTSTYPLILKKGGSEIQRTLVSLPDPSMLGTVSVDRAAFVEKVSKYTFEDGILTKVDITKPSEALAAIQIPIDVINLITAIPGEIVKLKFDYASENKKLYDAQKAESIAKDELINQLEREIEAGDPID